MSAPRVSAIVLAGGRSSRFGMDKLAVELDGRPLLWRAIDAVRPIVDEIVVAAGPERPVDLPAGVRLAVDDQAFEGPLRGVATGLKAATAPTVLVVGGDMPSLVPAVLERLTAAVEDERTLAALLGPADPSGDPGRPLPMAARRVEALAEATALLSTGERRLRALAERLCAVRIPADLWRVDDPAGRTLRDIDIPADLDG